MADKTPKDWTSFSTDITHTVSRISSRPGVASADDRMKLFFNPIGRSLEWGPGSADDPADPQDVTEQVAMAIALDEGLAPHFRLEPIAKEDAGGAPSAAAAGDAGAGALSAPKRTRRPER